VDLNHRPRPYQEGDLRNKFASRIETVSRTCDLIAPIFRKHSAEIGRVFADANPKELQILESVLKKAGKRARALAEERSKTRSR
jgi:hypothetical protein